jgi:predicted nucleic acid-binding protein
MYLLDTNVLSEIVRRLPEQAIVKKFSAFTKNEMFTSAICIEEIRFGAKIAPPGNRLWERTERRVLPYVTVLAVTKDLAIKAGDLRAEWKRRGTPIGYRDGLIAATAVGKDLIMVTRNVRHFDHVTDLQVENWFDVKPENPSDPEPP